MGHAAGGQATLHTGSTFNRRQFLVGTSAVAAAYTLMGPNGSAGSDAATELLDGPVGALGELAGRAKRALSVGYVEGSAALGLGTGLGLGGADALRAAGAAGLGRVVPALGMQRGDAALHGTTANFGVHGLTPGLPAGTTRVHFDAMLPAPRPLDAGTLLPFYAWQLSSNPTSFGVSLDRSPRLGFTLDTGDDVAAAGFTTGRHPGMARLREGLYLLALAPGAWDQARPLPAWDDSAAWDGLTSMILTVTTPTP